MYTILGVAGLFLIASIFVALLYRPIIRLVQSIFSLLLSPLATVSEKLAIAIGWIHSRITESGLSFAVYFIGLFMFVCGSFSSFGSFVMTSFGLEVLSLGDVVVIKTIWGGITGTVLLAISWVIVTWIFCLVDSTIRKQAKQEEQQSKPGKKPKKNISWFRLAFIGIVIIGASLAWMRTMEIEGVSPIPIIGANAITSSAPVEIKGFIAAAFAVIMDIAICLVSGPAVEYGIWSIALFAMCVTVIIFCIIWLCKQIITSLSVISYRILALLFSFGAPLIKGVKKLKRGNKNVIVLSAAILLLSLTNSGCVLPHDTSGKSEAVIILDTSYSFKNLLRQAIKLSETIILNLPPNSELTIIKIDKRSYEQRSEIAYVKVPSRSNRETYAKTARAVYDEMAYGLKKSAIDSLRKVLSINSSPATDIWGAIAYSSTLFHDSTSKKILIIMSDLLDNVSIEPDSCDFRGVKIWVLFVIHTDSPSEYKTRVAQYEEYFIKHGALSVKFLNPIRSSTVDVKEILELEGGGQ